MAKLSKIEYETLKSFDPADLTNDDRRDINDYERAEANAPSNEDVEWATEIHNMASKNPNGIGAELKATGDYDKAMKILDQERAYAALKGGRTAETYVQPVKRIPDDLIEGNDFKFNWKSVYENVKGEKLRDTEADYDKLKKFIDSNMYDVTDPVSLQKIAYDFHMYNPNTMSWKDFIDSEQGKEFKKYIKDVEKYQKDKAVDEIFNNESNFAVDFGFPVTKEYARKNYENINGIGDMMGPLAADAVTNFLMAVQPGSKSSTALINKGSNFLAPAVQNAGQYLYNDMDPTVAGVNTVMGGAVNIGTPYALNRLNRYTRMPGQQYSQRVEVGKRVSQIADKVGNIENRLNNGALRKATGEIENTVSGKVAKGTYYVSHAKKQVFTDYPALKEMFEADGYKVSPLKEMRNWKPGILSEADSKFYDSNSGILRRRPFSKTERDWDKAVYDNNARQRLDKEYKKVAESQWEGKDISQMNKPELEAILRGPARETYMDWASRKTPDVVKNYMTNAMGRQQMGTGVLSIPQMIFQTNLGKFVEERKKKKPKISEIFGGE